MAEHPIQGLMQTALENIREMIDVNTIVGDPVEAPDGTVIMPISRVGFGFAAGGSEFTLDPARVNNRSEMGGQDFPFGGGSGGGVSITPIAFLVVGKQGISVLPLDNQTHIIERIIDSTPQFVDRLQSLFKDKADTAAVQTEPNVKL